MPEDRGAVTSEEYSYALFSKVSFSATNSTTTFIYARVEIFDAEDILRALAGLLDLGYTPIGPSVDQVRRSWKAFRKFENHLRFHNPESGAPLELHWRLFREHRIFESAV
jgi:hypothetical protein